MTPDAPTLRRVLLTLRGGVATRGGGVASLDAQLRGELSPHHAAARRAGVRIEDAISEDELVSEVLRQQLRHCLKHDVDVLARHAPAHAVRARAWVHDTQGLAARILDATRGAAWAAAQDALLAVPDAAIRGRLEPLWPAESDLAPVRAAYLAALELPEEVHPWSLVGAVHWIAAGRPIAAVAAPRLDGEGYRLAGGALVDEIWEEGPRFALDLRSKKPRKPVTPPPTWPKPERDLRVWFKAPLAAWQVVPHAWLQSIVRLVYAWSGLSVEVDGETLDADPRFGARVAALEAQLSPGAAQMGLRVRSELIRAGHILLAVEPEVLGPAFALDWARARAWAELHPQRAARFGRSPLLLDSRDPEAASVAALLCAWWLALTARTLALIAAALPPLEGGLQGAVGAWIAAPVQGWFYRDGAKGEAPRRRGAGPLLGGELSPADEHVLMLLWRASTRRDAFAASLLREWAAADRKLVEVARTAGLPNVDGSVRALWAAGSDEGEVAFRGQATRRANSLWTFCEIDEVLHDRTRGRPEQRAAYARSVPSLGNPGSKEVRGVRKQLDWAPEFGDETE